MSRYAVTDVTHKAYLRPRKGLIHYRVDCRHNVPHLAMRHSGYGGQRFIKISPLMD